MHTTRTSARPELVLWVTAVRRAALDGYRAAVTSYRGTLRDRLGPARALLIDLDNLAVPEAAIAHTLHRVLAAAGPCREVAAAGHPFHSRPAQEICRTLGIRVLPTRTGINSADEALLAESGRLRAQGITHLYLCTHDGDLRRVAIRSYTVIRTGKGTPSRRLVAGARDVIDLSDPASRSNGRSDVA